MKNLHNKEKQFAEILSDINLDVNTDEIWGAIEHRLPENSPSKKILFWKLGGVIMLFLLFALGYFTVKDTGFDGVVITEQISENFQSEESQSSEVFQKSAALEAAIEKVAAKSNSEREYNDSNSRSPIAKESKEESKAQKVNSESRRSMNSKNLLQQESKLVARADVKQGFHYPSKKVNQTHIMLSATAPKSAVTVLDVKQSFEKLEPLNTLKLGVFALTPRELSDNRLPSIEVVKSTSRTFFKIGAGINFNSAHYEILVQEGPSQETLTQFESALPGAAVSLAAGIETSKGWRLFGGLRYEQLVNLYSNQNYFSNSEIVNGVQFLSLDESGNSTPVNGPLEQTTLVQNDVHWHRQFHNVDLELGVGKRLLQLDRWSIGAEASLLFNVVSSGTGYVFDTDFNAIKKFPQQIDNPFGTMGFGSAFSIQIERDFGENLTVFCSPSFSKYYGQLTSDSFYTTNNSQLGLQLGLKYWPRG